MGNKVSINKHTKKIDLKKITLNPQHWLPWHKGQDEEDHSKIRPQSRKMVHVVHGDGFHVSTRSPKSNQLMPDWHRSMRDASNKRSSPYNHQLFSMPSITEWQSLFSDWSKLHLQGASWRLIGQWAVRWSFSPLTMQQSKALSVTGRENFIIFCVYNFAWSVTAIPFLLFNKQITKQQKSFCI